MLVHDVVFAYFFERGVILLGKFHLEPMLTLQTLSQAVEVKKDNIV